MQRARDGQGSEPGGVRQRHWWALCRPEPGKPGHRDKQSWKGRLWGQNRGVRARATVTGRACRNTHHQILMLRDTTGSARALGPPGPKDRLGTGELG